MLNPTRLLFGMLVSCGITLVPFMSAQAQSAIGAQAYAQMNQVQRAQASGLLNPAQASDLINRYNDIVMKDQQWSLQDGGRLNVPDRLDLQGKLNRANKRLSNDLQNNGYATTGTGLLGNIFNGGYNSPLYGLMNNSGCGALSYNYGAPLLNNTGFGSSVLNGLGAPLLNGYSNYPYATNYPYNNSGIIQGLLNRWRGY